MIRRTLNLSAATAALLLFAAGAAAAEQGFYVFASAGTADEDPETAGINVGNSQGVFHVYPDSVDVDSGQLAWSAGLGYRINRYLSGEVEYIDFGTTDVVEHYVVPNIGFPIPYETFFDMNYSSNITGPALSLLGTLPIGENLELYLRGGALFSSRGYKAGFGALDEKFSDTVWLAGAGVKWSFAKRWAVRGEYQQTGETGESFASGKSDVKRMSLSVLFAL